MPAFLFLIVFDKIIILSYPILLKTIEMLAMATPNSKFEIGQCCVMLNRKMCDIFNS